MQCPFPITDYYSALAHADWLEEQGDSAAEQTRHLTCPPFGMWAIYGREDSTSKSLGGSKKISRCDTVSNYQPSASTCQSRKGERLYSSCNNQTISISRSRQRHINYSNCSSRRITLPPYEE